MKNWLVTQYKKNKKYFNLALFLSFWYILFYVFIYLFESGFIQLPKSDSISAKKMEYVAVSVLGIVMTIGIIVTIVVYYFKNFGGFSTSGKVDSNNNESNNIYGFRSLSRTNTKIKNSIIFLAHCVLWILVLIIFVHYDAKCSDDQNVANAKGFIDSSTKIAFFIMSFYAGYWLTPFFFSKQDGKRIILIIVFYAVTISLVFAFPGLVRKQILLTFTQMLIGFSLLTLSIILGIGFRSLFGWVEQKRLQEILEKQNMKSELALLRSQLNPHFLFNTLHNIDALIKNDQDIASKSLIKLSDIMRYMLNDSKLEQVPVEKELMHIENYISLEKLRFKNNNFLNYSLTGNYANIKIAPMLFIPFVENAFKHSVDSDLENGISIHFYFENNVVKFICENLRDNLSVEKDKTHGIGLETVKRRLGLIYPGKHQLEIEETPSTYKVQLEIFIDEN